METMQMRKVPGLAKIRLDQWIQDLSEVASLLHQEWLDKKKQEQTDPGHPFKGCIPDDSPYVGRDRVRVSDIKDVEEARRLGVRIDPNDKRDIYHALFRPYSELEAMNSEAVRKNKISGWAVINQIAAMLDTGEDSLDDLENLLNLLLDLEEKAIDINKTRYGRLLRKQVYLAVHNVWGGGELMRGADPSQHPDFRLYDLLSPYMQSYDIDLAHVVMKWLREKVQTLHRKDTTD